MTEPLAFNTDKFSRCYRNTANQKAREVLDYSIQFEEKNNKTKQDKNKEYTEVSGSTANAKFKSR